MKLKLTKDGHAVVQAGKPVYIHADGREEAIDAAGTVTALRRSLFESSKFVAEKLSIPADVAMASFGGSFKVENGKVVAYDKGGIPIYSRTRHGELANFEESIEQIVERYPDKSMILRTVSVKAAATAAPAAPGAKAPALSNSIIKRAEFEALNQRERMAFAVGGGKVVD